MNVNNIVKKIPWVITFLGIFLLVFGFYYEVFKVGVPYQDPTPELIQRYQYYSDIAQFLYRIGIGIIVLGLLSFLTLAIRKIVCGKGE